MRTRVRRSEAGPWVLGLLAGLGVGASCWRPADGHCGNLDGDLTCSERSGGRYCDACQADGDGCTDVVPSEGCYFPGLQGTSTGGVESTSSESSTGSTGSTSADSSSGSSSSSTTGPVPCVSDEDCPDSAMPFCEPASGACVSCEQTRDPDATCAEQGIDSPYCVGGACVECTEHVQCAGGAACNLFTNECLPERAVFHVGMGQSYPTLLSAWLAVAQESVGTIIVHGGTYPESISITTDAVVAFLAAPDAPVYWTSMTGSQLTVTAGTVLLDGVDFVGGPASDWAVSVFLAEVWIDGAWIAPRAGGVAVTGQDADVRLRNCMISTTDAPGLHVSNGATVQALQTTMIRTGIGPGAALACESLPYAVDLRNSIVLALGGVAGDELSCPGVMELDNATEADMGVEELDPLWFVDLADDDLHLSKLGAATFADRGVWRSGDPPVDIDGNPRPAVDGAPDYPGADVPTP
jgi:hypothetical protein